MNNLSISDLLSRAEEQLSKADIPLAKLDAEVLLADTMQCERIDLHLKRAQILSEESRLAFDEKISRRALREPIAYIRGKREFWSRDILVSPAVLIPRPETESLVDEALNIARRIATPSILDLCTGSGCIAAALAHELPEASITVTDISPEAIDVARQNLAFAQTRIEFYVGDLFDALNFSPMERGYDLITANPPYLADHERGSLQPEIAFEPDVALRAGPSGLSVAADILEAAYRYLTPDGWLVLECGRGQAPALQVIAEGIDAYQRIMITKDLSGNDRVLSLQKRGEKCG